MHCLFYIIYGIIVYMSFGGFMRVYYVSDYHFSGFVSCKDISGLPPLSEVGDDWLVVAGDVSSNSIVTSNILGYLSNYFNKVFFVLGNLEYREGSRLGFTYEEVELRYKYLLHDYRNIYFLNNSEITLDGIRVVGSTNWYSLPTNYSKALWDTMSHDKGYSHPNTVISNKHYKRDNDYLTSIKGKIDLLITHVPPMHFPHNRKDLDYAYYQPVQVNTRYWICGHQHVITDTEYWGARVLANPVGFENEDTGYSVRYIDLEVV